LIVVSRWRAARLVGWLAAPRANQPSPGPPVRLSDLARETLAALGAAASGVICGVLWEFGTTGHDEVTYTSYGGEIQGLRDAGAGLPRLPAVRLECYAMYFVFTLAADGDSADVNNPSAHLAMIQT